MTSSRGCIETRRIIRAALPSAEETISYNIPAYKPDGLVVVQFAGYTEHTSLDFFPSAATFAHFTEELAPYKTSKSAIRFPIDEPLPVDLIDADHAVPRQRSRGVRQPQGRRGARAQTCS